jgi:hypothetical protein
MLKFFRSLLFLFVSLSSFSLYAAKNEQIDNLDKMIVYIELDSIKKSKDTISYWLIFDLKNEQTYNGKPIKSISSEVRANCTTKKTENVLSTFFKGNMGKGEFLIAEPNQKYDFEIPSQVLEKYTTLVCNRK